MPQIRMTYPMSCCNEIEIDGQRMRLRPAPARLAEFLLLRPDWANYDDIIEWMWPDPDLQPLTARRAITVYNSYLREKGMPVEADWNGRVRFKREHHQTPLFARGMKLAA